MADMDIALQSKRDSVICLIAAIHKNLVSSLGNTPKMRARTHTHTNTHTAVSLYIYI